MGDWMCAFCVGESKMWALDHPGVLVGAPVIKPAITILGGSATCADHIQVQRQTPLIMPTHQFNAGK